jgi:hypothetical protein
MNVIKGVLGINDAPPPPDYAAAAREKAAGDLKAAEAATQANRANQVNPYGSLTWSQTTGPDGKPVWTQTTSLNETGQKLLDADNKSKLGLAGLQEQAVSRVKSAQDAGWNDTNLNKAGTALDPSKAGALNADGSAFKFSVGGTGGSNVGDRTSYYDASKVGPTGQVYDPNSDTNDATQRILSRLNPQLDRRRAATESQLANQGITRGSEAWKNAMSDMGQQENDAYTQAGLQGITLGQSQQAQTYGQQMGNRSALTNDQKLLADQQMGVRAQDIQQAGINTQAATAASQMALQSQITGQQMGLAAQQQGFNQNQQAQNTAFNQNNALRATGLQEQNYFANRDINQLNAIRSGSQVNNPTFGSYAQQQTTQGADALTAANMGYQGQLAANNANNANSFGVIKGISSIFGGP